MIKKNKKHNPVSSKVVHRWVFSLGVFLLLAVIAFGGFNNNFLTKKPQTDKVTNLLSGEWHYLPGAKRNKDGLMISPQGNAPINLIGTSLSNLSENFVVTFVLDRKESSASVVQLYGKLPIMTDEFRYEQGSLRLAFSKKELIATLWDGSSEKPLITQSFAVSPEKIIRVRLSKQDETLQITVNNEIIGTIPESGIFSSGNVWFGFDGAGREWLLSNLTLEKSVGEVSLQDRTEYLVNRQKNPSLHALAQKKRPDFVIGTTAHVIPLASDSAYTDLALDNQLFGSITPLGTMSMNVIQPQRDEYEFAYADGIIHLAEQNNIPTIHGGPLISDKALPAWFTDLAIETEDDKKRTKQIMIDYLTTVIAHFRTTVQTWDVIAFPLADESGFREHQWYQAMGESYLVTALESAHQSDPDATLFIVESGLASEGEKWDTFVEIMQDVRGALDKRDIPLEKIGVHFFIDPTKEKDPIDPVVLRQHLQTMELYGFKTQLSEVMDPNLSEGQSAQLLLTCLAEKSCIRWTVAILSDQDDPFITELHGIGYRQTGLFDMALAPRPILTELQAALQKK